MCVCEREREREREKETYIERAERAERVRESGSEEEREWRVKEIERVCESENENFP